MKYLSPGLESQNRVELLLQLTGIRSEAIQEAIYWHLVKGHDETNSAQLAGVSLSNFNRALKALNEHAEIVEKIKEDDWRRFNYKANENATKEKCTVCGSCCVPGAVS